MVLTGWEAVFFWVFATAALVSGLLTVLARNAVHSALFLISALIAVAALFVLLGAEFIAGVQILVYVGGVMVLFLFVIMLINVSAQERGNEVIFNRTPQVATSLIFSLLLAFGLVYAIRQGVPALRGNEKRNVTQLDNVRAAQNEKLQTSATGTSKITTDTETVGGSLYRYGGLPFEIASVLLLVAIIGSVMLARTVKQEAAVDDVDPESLKDMISDE
jgi:NADH-quinone oxidoreductase subunit J